MSVPRRIDRLNESPETRLDPEQPLLAVIAKMEAWQASLERFYDRATQDLLADRRNFGAGCRSTKAT
jgi:hypothetical protein